LTRKNKKVKAKNPFDSPQIKRVLKRWIENPKEMSDDQVKTYLSEVEIEGDSALFFLSRFKSEKKYGYCLDDSHLNHIIEIANKNQQTNPLFRLIQNPFMLVKAAWIYDHAPSFLLNSQETEGNGLDNAILQFAEDYWERYLHNEPATPSGGKAHNTGDAYQVSTTSFWERNMWDPIESILAAVEKNLGGVELSVDFHPFNLERFLPEEVDQKKRLDIKQTIQEYGVKVAIHSPIVGPYAPYPDPLTGKQLFYYPSRCMMLMKETVQLAIDIGAEAVVVHLIDPEDFSHLAELINSAAGSEAAVSIENYCYTKTNLNSKVFLETLTKILNALPPEIARNNFGVTYDVGHMNIEGTDPLIAAVEVGKWCLKNHVHFRLHATDNYGQLHFTPPHYSADIHASVSGRGIHNAMIIKLLRSLGLEFHVVAEQIEPLSKEDILAIDQAQRYDFTMPYETILKKGRELIGPVSGDPVITNEGTRHEEAYQFVAGLEGLDALYEYLLFRKIQEKKYLTTDAAKKSTIQMMSMPQRVQMSIIEYLDDLLSPIQRDMAEFRSQDVDIICQNVAGGLFGTLNNRQLNRIFSRKSKTFKKGEAICRQNTIGKEIYFIKKGTAEVFLDGNCVAILKQGEIFGEISLLFDIPRTATVRAAEDKMIVGILDRGRFMATIKSLDESSKALIYRLHLFLPARLRALDEKYKIVIFSLIQMIETKEIWEGLIDEIEQQILGKKNLQSNLTSKDLNELFTEELHCPQGKVIFREGELADGAYIIKKGGILISSHVEDREILLTELGEREIFGEMALIDGEPRSADAKALSDTILGFLRKETFNRLINERSELSYRLMSSICLGLLRHIYRLDNIYLQVKSLIRQGQKKQ